jgi:hypothetical protein
MTITLDHKAKVVPNAPCRSLFRKTLVFCRKMSDAVASRVFPLDKAIGNIA